MKVKMLVGMAGPEEAYAPGEQVDMDAATARRLIKSGAAVRVEPARAKSGKKGRGTSTRKAKT